MEACETYLRLALKAQSQCRTTIEALAFIKNPRWTTERRAGNRRSSATGNRGRATGPKTPEGMARSSLNALKHGMGRRLLKDLRRALRAGGKRWHTQPNWER